MGDKTKYSKDSIKSISPREFTRLHPGTYAGSTEYSTQLIRELFANALDEHIIKHGNLIKISVNTKENKYIVEDEGQGFPVNVKRPDGETVLSASFSVLNTSGKYDEDGVYGASALGLNGIGAKLVCYLSKWSMITSTDGSGNRETVWYEDGLFQKRKVEKENKNVHGTRVEYIPDPQFFQHKEANLNELKELFTDIAALCPNLTIELTVDGKETVFHSANGIQDLVDKKVKNKEVIKQRFFVQKQKGDNLLDLCLTYTSDYSESITPYINYGLTDSGIHIATLRSNLTRTINKYAAANNLFKKDEGNLTGQELAEGLVLVFNLKANGVQYDSQSKTRVVGIDCSLINEAVNQDFAYWLNDYPKEAKTIIEKALQARRAKLAAQKARDSVRGIKSKKEKGLKAKMALSNKFVDCVSKNPKERNLLLVEGTSAASSAIEARNVKTDCIYMLRGKVISPLKQSIDKILANQEISDIIKVIGGGFGKDFDLSKVQFDKIVITSDQDSDGMDIELLLLTFFYTYMRPLVEAGMVYRAVTPLYIMRQKGKEYYAYSDTELEEWRNQNPGTFELVRAKGLGELNAQDLKKVCFDNQRFKRIMVTDCEATTELLETLQGQAVGPRKQYIYDNAHKLGFNFN